MFVSTTATSIVGIVAIVVLTQTVPAAGLGAYFLFEALLGLAGIGVNFGLNTATEKRISEGQAASEVLFTATVLKLVTLVIAAAVLLAVSPAVDGYLGEPWTGLLVLTIATRELSRLTVRTHRGEFRMQLFAFLRFFRQLVWAAAAIGGVVLLDLGNVSLVYGLVVSHLVTMVIALSLLDLRPVLPSWNVARSLFDYARYNVLTVFGGYIYSWMDTAILGLFVAPGLVAAYEIAWRVTKLVPTVLGSISETTFPQISEWQVAGDLDRAGSVVSQSLLPSLVIAIPSLFGIVALSRETLLLVFGEAYAVASVALVVLMLSQVLWSAESIFKRALHAVDRPDLPVRSMLVAFVANVTLNVALIPVLGLLGAALATTTAFGLQTAMDYAYLDSLLPLSLPVSEVAWSIFSASVMLLAVLGATQVLPVTSIPLLFLVVFFGVLVYFTVLVVHGGLRSHIAVLQDEVLHG